MSFAAKTWMPFIVIVYSLYLYTTNSSGQEKFKLTCSELATDTYSYFIRDLKALIQSCLVKVCALVKMNVRVSCGLKIQMKYFLTRHAVQEYRCSRITLNFLDLNKYKLFIALKRYPKSLRDKRSREK